MKLIASRQLFNFEEQKCPRFFLKSYHFVDIADFREITVTNFCIFQIGDEADRGIDLDQLLDMNNEQLMKVPTDTIENMNAKIRDKEVSTFLNRIIT